MCLPLTRCWAMHRFPSPTDTPLFAFVSLGSLPLQESFCRHESVVCSAAMDVYTAQGRSKLTLHAYLSRFDIRLVALIFAILGW